jgi:hypothetical protein
MRPSSRLLAGVVLLAAGVACRNPTGPSDVDLTGPAGESKILESGWSKPVRLRFSDDGFEDSPYITRDGKYVMFFYHPAHDILTDPEAATALQLDGRIYISPRQFEAKALYPVSTPDATSEGGPSFGTGGAFFYYRTFPFSNQPLRIVRNGVILDLGTGGAELDPFYCDAMDELYFAGDGQGSRAVYVFKNGRSTRLPAPINDGSRNMHPFVTDDCQTMYFSSTRSSAPFPRVYRSRRQGEFQWSSPELFISKPSGGVGELTMTKDGKEMTFIELQLEGGGATSNVYYSWR